MHHSCYTTNALLITDKLYLIRNLFSLVWASKVNSAMLLTNDDPGGPKSRVRKWQNYEEHFTKIHKSHCEMPYV